MKNIQMAKIFAVVLLFIVVSAIFVNYNRNSAENVLIKQAITIGHNEYNVKISAVPIDKKTSIIEATNVGHKNTLILKKGGQLFKSTDEGKTLTPICKTMKLPKTHFISEVFTMKNGHRLVFAEDKQFTRTNNIIYEFDNHNKLIADTDINAYPWFQNIGIGEDKHGNVIFAEGRKKRYEKQMPTSEISVYKRLSAGKYEKILTEAAGIDRKDKSTINRFQFIKPIRNQWLLLTFGCGKPSNLSVLNNQGNSFEKVTIEKNKEIKLKKIDKIYIIHNMLETNDGHFIGVRNGLLEKKIPSILTYKLQNNKLFYDVVNTLEVERTITNIFALGKDLYLLSIKAKHNNEFYIYDYNTNDYTDINLKTSDSESSIKVLGNIFNINNNVYMKLQMPDKTYCLAKITVK